MKMTCVICNQIVDAAHMPKHLIKMHRITAEQYYTQYLKHTTPKCPICGNNSKFISISKGYYITCSYKCGRKSWHNNLKDHFIKLHGEDNPFKIEIYKEKIRQTNLKNTGEEYPNRFGGEKFKKMLEGKYGKDFYKKLSKLGNEAFQKKYKLSNPSQSKEIQLKKKLNRFIKKYGKIVNRDKNILSYNYINGTFNCFCKDCGKSYTISAKIYINRFKNKETICSFCNPIKKIKFKEQHDLYNIVSQLCNDNVIESTKHILNSGKELDIWVPKYNIGIEYNGSYWHSETFREKTYHYDKYTECFNQGIKLINVFDFDWKSKKDYIINKIKESITNVSYKTKCTFKEVENTIAKDFIEKYGLNIEIDKNVKNVGLYENNVLVHLVGLKNSVINYYCSKYEWYNKESLYEFHKFLKLKNENLFIILNNDFADDKLFESIGYKYKLDFDPTKTVILSGKKKLNVWNSGYRLYEYCI